MVNRSESVRSPETGGLMFEARLYIAASTQS